MCSWFLGKEMTQGPRLDLRSSHLGDRCNWISLSLSSVFVLQKSLWRYPKTTILASKGPGGTLGLQNWISDHLHGDVLLAYPKKQMGSSRWHLVGDNPSVSSVSLGDRSFFTGMCYFISPGVVAACCTPIMLRSN